MCVCVCLGVYRCQCQKCVKMLVSQSPCECVWRLRCVCVWVCAWQRRREKNTLSRGCHLLSRLSSSANKQYPPVPVTITHVCPFISAQRETEEEKNNGRERDGSHTHTQQHTQQEERFQSQNNIYLFHSFKNTAQYKYYKIEYFLCVNILGS